MAYSTLTDLKKLLPENMLVTLSNDSAGATRAKSTNIDEAIDQADREIDAYILLAGYSVPMDPVPPLIANLSAKMAIWNLHLRKYFDSTVWKDTYSQCLKTLERIAERKLTLGQMETGETTTGSVSPHSTGTREQKFTEDFMEQF